MAPLPVIADTFRTVWHWTDGGQHAVNVVHVRCPTGDALDVAGGIDGSLQTSQFALLNSSATFGTIEVTPLDGTSPTLLHNMTSIHKTGGGGGQPVPQVACLVKLVTGLRGRSHRGRIFLPFASESEMDSGSFDATDAGVMQTAWGNFETALAALPKPIELVVASYKLAEAFSVTAVSVELETATQRRRQTRNRR
jgi:hypothetical protein